MGRISYSQLSLYNECPMHWKLRYVDKVSIDKSSIHLIFGSAMHTTLQMYLDTMYRESIKIADALDLSEILEEELVKEFKEAEKKYGTKPCKLEDINEFFNDGIFIIDWFKKHRAEYFNKRNWKLIGCEVPLNVELKNNIRFIGFIDIIMHHVPTNRYKIIDIKTSTRGWNKYQKKDKNKTAQLLLYKQFFAKQNNCTVEDIDVEWLEDFISNDEPRNMYVEGYFVYSSRRKNPTGRGKTGWSIGLATNNMFMLTKETYSFTDNTTTTTIKSS